MKRTLSKLIWAFVFPLILTGFGVDSLREVHAVVPVAVKRGDNAVLRCLFNLEGDALYSVKWYKSGHEIYRYIPKETPSIKTFPIHGIEIEKSKSNATQLYLRKVGLSFSGRYSCEVSADAPSFSTAFVSGDMHVVIIPKSLPEVQGMKSRYKVGDTLKATCISKHSRPAANLTWFLNSQTLSSDYIRQFSVLRESKSDLETSVSTVSFKVQKEHFKLKGRLKVRCIASIHNIYWRTSENSAEEERPKASVVAAQDYRLHDIFRKPNEFDYEVTTPMASSINRHCDFSSYKSLLLPLLNIFLLYFSTSC